jgi:hypothetical protein
VGDDHLEGGRGDADADRGGAREFAVDVDRQT